MCPMCGFFCALPPKAHNARRWPNVNNCILKKNSLYTKSCGIRGRRSKHSHARARGCTTLCAIKVRHTRSVHSDGADAVGTYFLYRRALIESWLECLVYRHSSAPRRVKTTCRGIGTGVAEHLLSCTAGVAQARRVRFIHFRGGFSDDTTQRVS